MRMKVRPSGGRGFTLLELLVTIAVASITTVIAIPSLSQFLSNNRMASQANSFVSAVRYARSEAVSTSRAVSVCPYEEDPDEDEPAARYRCRDTTTWSAGWVVVRPALDDAGVPTGGNEVLRVFPPLEGGDTLNGSANSINYNAAGFLSNASAPSFALRPARCQQQQRRVIAISLQGRPHVSHADC